MRKVTISTDPKPPVKVRKLVTSKTNKRWLKAKQKLEQIEAEILRRSPLSESVIRPKEFYADSFDIVKTSAEWLESKRNRCSVSDLKNAANAIQWLSDFAGKNPLTKRLASEFCDSLHGKKGYSQNTCFLMGAKIREFLRWLLISGRCQQDYGAALQWPTAAPQRARHTYSHSEYCKLEKSNRGYNAHWLIVLLWGTGMASVDACDLRWGQVDLDNLIIKRQIGRAHV